MHTVCISHSKHHNITTPITSNKSLIASPWLSHSTQSHSQQFHSHTQLFSHTLNLRQNEPLNLRNTTTQQISCLTTWDTQPATLPTWETEPFFKDNWENWVSFSDKNIKVNLKWSKNSVQFNTFSNYTVFMLESLRTSHCLNWKQS